MGDFRYFGLGCDYSDMKESQAGWSDSLLLDGLYYFFVMWMLMLPSGATLMSSDMPGPTWIVPSPVYV